MAVHFSGVQQMGIGVPNVQEIWPFYRKFFGMDVRVFEDEAEAALMTKYTGGEVHKRTATLAISMRGGGGFEIWQYTSRGTEKAEFDIKLGDLGLYACRMKSKDVAKSYAFFQKNGANVSELGTTPGGQKHFFVTDPNGNIFNVVDSTDWFGETGHPGMTGGVAGALVGVSNMDKSIAFYRDVLGFDNVKYDASGKFEDFAYLPDGDQEYRRVLLERSEKPSGPFSKLMGESKIELVQALNKEGRFIFENRYWGDWGFIHLCFDVQGMNELKKKCDDLGAPFTVDSGETFDMGEAGGRFTYIEDPDGAWIELVETHKVPILKKLNWSIDLTKRNPAKALPSWMLKTMSMNRVKG